MPVFSRAWFWMAFTGLVLGGLARADEPGAVPGQFLVRFGAGTTPQKAQSQLDARSFQLVRVLVPELGLYLVKTKTRMSAKGALSLLATGNGILYAQPDHLVQLRDTLPDATLFTQQWSLSNPTTHADIRATQAWDMGPGGKDRDGNDIVIAIVDGGMDITHPNLERNLWVNRGEIPGNGIDDDQNGYIDDVNGWNAYANNGTIPVAAHGTHVAGIAGAEGNHHLQVTGVNWNVKLMPIAASSSTTSVIAAGYGYALAQKKLWIQTHGAKGANIVVTNSSFGVDLADCTKGDYPAWNDLYNAMGQVGILSAAATANRNVDVDQKGDVPTGCTSPYLVKVTNTDRADQKYAQAAFGLKMVELGAPGTAILSTLPGNKTGTLTGTSMATPHVAGAIAFLYSVASSDFQRLTQSDPAKASQVLKGLLLGSVDKIPSLDKITVTGGRLNLAAAAHAIAAYAQ